MQIDEIISFLDHEGVLSLPEPNNSEEQPNPQNEELQFSEVDWKKIFPDKGVFRGKEIEILDHRLIGIGKELRDPDFEQLDEDPWEMDLPVEFSEKFISEVEKDFVPQENETPFDRCAWYCPIHYYLHDWGIYIKSECIQSIALKIGQCLPSHYKRFLVHRNSFTNLIIKHCMRAAFCVLYLHEFYHHKVESFGLRLQTVQGKGSYLRYKENIYQRLKGDTNQLEEALANADAFIRLKSKVYKRCILSCILKATETYLRKSFPVAPAGYNQALKYIKARDFKEGEHELQSRIQEGTLNHKQDTNRWSYSPNMMKGFFNCRSEIYEVISTKHSSTLPSIQKSNGGFCYTTYSQRELKKVCVKLGWEEIPRGGKGSHAKFKKSGHRHITLPHGKQLAIGTQKNILKSLKINESQLKQILDGSFDLQKNNLITINLSYP